MKTKFKKFNGTQGEWFYEEYISRDNTGNPCGYYIMNKQEDRMYDLCIGHCDSGLERKEEMGANAKLVSKSKEMMDLLLDMVKDKEVAREYRVKMSNILSKIL